MGLNSGQVEYGAFRVGSDGPTTETFLKPSLGIHVVAGDTPALTAAGCRPLPLGRSLRKARGYCLVCCCPARFSFMKASARFDISAGGTSSTCVAIVQTWPKGSSTVPERSP